jgi:hypothetical protein
MRSFQIISYRDSNIVKVLVRFLSKQEVINSRMHLWMRFREVGLMTERKTFKDIGKDTRLINREQIDVLLNSPLETNIETNGNSFIASSHNLNLAMSDVLDTFIT